MNLTVAKISKGSIFKILTIGLGLGFFVLFLLFGVAAFFGAETVKWDEQPVIGLNGLLLAMAFWPIFTGFFVCFMWLFTVIGLWIYSKLKPLTLKVTYLEEEGEGVL